MAALPTARWERFAQYRAAGLTQAEAYRAAGYKGASARTGGWKVEQQKSVEERIAALSDERLENACEPYIEAEEDDTVDLAWLLRSGKALFKSALRYKDFGTASVTLERVAKISGHWMEGRASDDNNNNRGIRIFSERPLTEEEWRELHVPAEYRKR